VKMYDRGFDRQIRAAVRAECRSQKIKRIRRRGLRSGVSFIILMLVRLAWTVGFWVAMMLAGFESSSGLPRVVALGGSWFLVNTAAGSLLMSGLVNGGNPALMLLPISATNLEWRAKRAALHRIWPTLADSLCFFVFLAWMSGSGWTSWLWMPFFAAFLALLIWGMTLVGARFARGKAMTWLGQGLFCAAIFLCVVRGAGMFVIRFVGENPLFFAALTPAGWLGAAYLAVVGALPRVWAFALLPMAVLAFGLRHARRRLIRGERMEADMLWEYFGEASTHFEGQADQAIRCLQEKRTSGKLDGGVDALSRSG